MTSHAKTFEYVGLAFHVRRAGREITAAADGYGRVAQREDGRYAFVEIGVRVTAVLDPRAENVPELVAKAERDCLVGASSNIELEYEWHLS